MGEQKSRAYTLARIKQVDLQVRVMVSVQEMLSGETTPHLVRDLQDVCHQPIVLQ